MSELGLGKLYLAVLMVKENFSFQMLSRRHTRQRMKHWVKTYFGQSRQRTCGWRKGRGLLHPFIGLLILGLLSAARCKNKKVWDRGFL